MPITVYEVQTKTLNDADHLFHCCVRGLRWNSLSPIRWVADAHILNCAAEDLGRHLLLERTEAMQLVRLLREALHYLRETIKSLIPDFVFEPLDSLSISQDEMSMFDIKTRKTLRFALLHYLITLGVIGRLKVRPQNWQDGQTVFMDQNITLHARPTNVKDGDQRTMARMVSFLDKLFPNQLDDECYLWKGETISRDEFIGIIDSEREKLYLQELQPI